LEAILTWEPNTARHTAGPSQYVCLSGCRLRVDTENDFRITLCFAVITDQMLCSQFRMGLIRKNRPTRFRFTRHLGRAMPPCPCLRAPMLVIA